MTTSTITTTYRVDGMTCGHCAGAVSQEITALPGVRDVDVEVESGRVTVSSERDLSRDEVATAVDEAGYRLV